MKIANCKDCECELLKLKLEAREREVKDLRRRLEEQRQRFLGSLDTALNEGDGSYKP